MFRYIPIEFLNERSIGKYLELKYLCLHNIDNKNVTPPAKGLIAHDQTKNLIKNL